MLCALVKLLKISLINLNFTVFLSSGEATSGAQKIEVSKADAICTAQSASHVGCTVTTVLRAGASCAYFLQLVAIYL